MTHILQTIDSSLVRIIPTSTYLEIVGRWHERYNYFEWRDLEWHLWCFSESYRNQIYPWWYWSSQVPTLWWHSNDSRWPTRILFLEVPGRTRTRQLSRTWVSWSQFLIVPSITFHSGSSKWRGGYVSEIIPVPMPKIFVEENVPSSS